MPTLPSPRFPPALHQRILSIRRKTSRMNRGMFSVYVFRVRFLGTTTAREEGGGVEVGDNLAVQGRQLSTVDTAGYGVDQAVEGVPAFGVHMVPCSSDDLWEYIGVQGI
ncbi:hypothetical protein ACOMHN_031098 [Nucella lapillus]